MLFLDAQKQSNFGHSKDLAEDERRHRFQDMNVIRITYYRLQRSAHENDD